MATRQWLRLGMALAAVLTAVWLAWLAGVAMAPFIIGALLAYLLAPLVQWLASLTSFGGKPQKRWARPVAVLVIYIGVAGLLTGGGFLTAPIVAGAVQDFLDQRGEIIVGFQEEVDRWLFLYRDRVPEDLQLQVDGWVAGFFDQAGALLGTVAQNTFGVALESFSVLLGFLVIPIWLFLFVKDQPRFAAWFYGLFPVWMRPDVREVVTNAGWVLGTYIRMQVLLAAAIGLMTYVGLFFLGVEYPIPLSITTFLLTFVPIVGPILAGAIAIAVVLATDPGWMLLWVLLLYVGVQQVESYILLPRLQGGALNVHPALVIVLVVVLS
ncbi:MAG: AI-2E family transporter, partial [Dehalococcoidia bacterium]